MRIKIGLSESAPIQIEEGDWPVIARESWTVRGDGVRAGISTDASMCVRQHANGQRLVYGTASHSVYAGFLLPPSIGIDDSTVRAIRRVAGRIGASTSKADALIMALPAKDI